MSLLKKLQKELNSVSNKERAKKSAGYFKTGKGEYGEGDIFLGITVPVQRKIAHQFLDLSFRDIEKLLESSIHEYRFVALEILVAQYEKAKTLIEQKSIVDFYLAHTARINNWDLVDTSASYILGHFLFDKERSVLYKLVRSNNMWERRISIIATQYFINKLDFKDTLSLTELLLRDTHDLMHKACGWMLREVGKKDVRVLKDFLKKHYAIMPRTCLRYAIERFPVAERQQYLKGLV